jgi:ADP-ribosylglycohydrolase
MLGYMTWNQPPGTWSDDGSLTLCLAESLCNGYNIENIGALFCKWYQAGYWGAHDKVFDIGGATRFAIERIIKGTSAKLSGGFEEDDNGNGSLMRILPIAFYLQNEEDINKVYEVVKEVSGITHAHFRSVFSCFIYIIFALELIKGNNKQTAYRNMQNRVYLFAKTRDFDKDEIGLFDRILANDISKYKEPEIKSSGYVLHSLEAALWCLMTGSTFKNTVLKAVNLGEDTDTTAAITGGLAGLVYGYNNIPLEWIVKLARHNDIEDLCDRLEIILK